VGAHRTRADPSYWRASRATYSGRTRRTAQLRRPGMNSTWRPVIASSRLRDHCVGVDHELLRRTVIEDLVALGRVVEGDDLHIDDLGDRHAIEQDRLHQLTVVLHDRGLASEEGMALRPAEPEADRKAADLRLFVDGPWVFGDVEAGDADPAGGAGDLHQRVENSRGRLLTGMRPVPPRLEADRVDRAIHLRRAENLPDLGTQIVMLRQVYRLETHGTRVPQPFGIHIADDRAGGAEKLAGRSGRHSDRPGPGDIDGRAWAHAGADCAVEAGRQDVRQTGEVAVFCEGLIVNQKVQLIQIFIVHHHVVDLPAYPVSHVDIAISSSGAG